MAVLSAMLLLTGCGTGITKIKYIQDRASTQLRLPDDTIVNAAPGHHFTLYLINCIDNSTRDEAFFFTVDRLRDFNNQNSLVDGTIVPPIYTLVATGDTEEFLGQVVMELPGAPEDAFENLYYASHGSESVLMVNQLPLGEKYGPALLFPTYIDLANDTSSPFIDDENPCANEGSYHN